MKKNYNLKEPNHTYATSLLDIDTVIQITLSFVVLYRNFFGREAGRNAVEFIKDAPDGETIVLALKFDSKAIAKDVINR